MRSLRSLVHAGVTLALLLPASAFASQARIDALGLQADFVQDYVNVIHYPSTIVKYQNLVYGDLGIKDTDGGDLAEFEDNDEIPSDLENSARSMGAHLKLWKDMPGVFGIQFNENATPISPAYGANYWNRNRNQGLMLLWGHDFGGVTAGVQFNNTSSEFEATDISLEPIGGGGVLPGPTGNSRQAMNTINAVLGARPWNTTGFGGGLSFDFESGGRSHTADIGIQYRSMSYESVIGAPGARVTDESDGGNGLSINMRSQYATSDNTYLVPVINYWSMSLDNRVSDEAAPGSDVESENSVTGWNIGLAESWVLRESDLVTLGLQVGSEEVEYDDLRPAGEPFRATYTTTPQIFGSAEVHPMSWFHVRLGASKALTSKLEVVDTASGETLEIEDSPLGYALGAGFRIGGRLDLDAVLNQDFAFTGGWAASGNEETPFSRLSATYRW